MKKCGKCDEQFEEQYQFDVCWKCGTELPKRKSKTRNSAVENTRQVVTKDDHGGAQGAFYQTLSEPLEDSTGSRFSFYWVIGLLALAVAVFGSFHIVTGLGGVQLLRRDAFGFSELYIDAAAITSMPMIVAFIHYPLGCRVLIREGLIGPMERSATTEVETSSSAPTQEKPPIYPIYVQLEHFAVNLTGGEHYLQVEVSFKVADLIAREEIKLRMSEIRTGLLRLLSTKQVADLNTPDGKIQLSEDIKKQVNKVLNAQGPEQGVVGVLFTSFVIQ